MHPLIGTKVTIWPKGCPEAEVEAEIVILSDNEQSIALCFEDKPGWYFAGVGFAVSAQGLMLLAYRERKGADWLDIRDGKPYTIKEL